MSGVVRGGVSVALAALLVGCVTRTTFEAEVARSRGYEHLLGECRAAKSDIEKHARALSTTGDKLEAERVSLVEERIALLTELDAMRAGNEDSRAELERERALRVEREAEIAEISKTYTGLVDSLEQELKSGQIEIQNLKGQLQVRAMNKILFDSGKVDIKPEGQAVLAKVAAQIEKVTNQYAIRVEGHTDDVPIATPRFPSNWELSAARATRVVRYLIEHGVAPTAIAAAGHGEFQPIASNDGADGRSRNRRIEIILVPRPPT